jgi:hypothetical protein
MTKPFRSTEKPAAKNTNQLVPTSLEKLLQISQTASPTAMNPDTAICQALPTKRDIGSYREKKYRHSTSSYKLNTTLSPPIPSFVSYDLLSHISTFVCFFFFSFLTFNSQGNQSGLEISRLLYSRSLTGSSFPPSPAFLKSKPQAMAPHTMKSSWVTMSTPTQTRRPKPTCE